MVLSFIIFIVAVIAITISDLNTIGNKGASIIKGSSFLLGIIGFYLFYRDIVLCGYLSLVVFSTWFVVNNIVNDINNKQINYIKIILMLLSVGFCLWFGFSRISPDKINVIVDDIYYKEKIEVLEDSISIKQKQLDSLKRRVIDYDVNDIDIDSIRNHYNDSLNFLDSLFNDKIKNN